MCLLLWVKETLVNVTRGAPDAGGGGGGGVTSIVTPSVNGTVG
jgi:hypothetical protein